MEKELQQIKIQVEKALAALQEVFTFSTNHILVVGCSTSEVMGKHIGTSGTTEVAQVLYQTLIDFQKKTGAMLAFQSCEHINRALVVDRKTAELKNLEEVSVVPVRKAGGAMAAYAYQQMTDPIVVEQIQADAGIDIGDTFIGMHLKQVVVPVRCEVKQIGQAHLTMAKTRPKLIGGPRAVYTNTNENVSCT